MQPANDMRQMTAMGRGIEDGSFAIIDEEAGSHGFDPTQWQVVRRVIHATADFEFASLIRFTGPAVAAGIAALRAGCPILVDVNMITAGLNADRLAAYGCQVHGFISDDDVIAAAKAANSTRAIEAMRKAHRLGLLNGAIVAIGNAPTALLEIARLVEEEGARPALVIGVPVGFVSAAESKERMLAVNTPSIVARGRKGGSPIAVAIIHALLLLSVDEKGVQPAAPGATSSAENAAAGRATVAPAAAHKAVTLIGMGDDGCLGLTARAMAAIGAAQVLAGGERHLGFFPEFRGERIRIGAGLTATIETIAQRAEDRNVAVLASGDPLFFGVGARLIERLGAEHVEVLPHPSSVQWAFARLGVPWEDATWISLHGRPRTGFLTRLQRLAKVAVLTDATNSPPVLARLLLEHGQGDWIAWVCENLAGAGERVRRFSLEELAAAGDIGPLNVLVLLRHGTAAEQGGAAPGCWRPPAFIPWLTEEAFAKRMPKKGLITKREVRLLSLAALNLPPDGVLWDVGAGSGSVSIEAAKLAPEGHIYAIEVDPEGVAICQENVRAHAVDNVAVIAGRAPEALMALEAPDAVFIGGSKGSMDAIVETAWERLRPRGRIVVNAITLDNVAETYQAFRRRNLMPEVSLIQIARGAPLASYLRYEALNPIHLFMMEKPAAEEAPQQAPEAAM